MYILCCSFIYIKNDLCYFFNITEICFTFTMKYIFLMIFDQFGTFPSQPTFFDGVTTLLHFSVIYSFTSHDDFACLHYSKTRSHLRGHGYEPHHFWFTNLVNQQLTLAMPIAFWIDRTVSAAKTTVHCRSWRGSIYDTNE